MCKEENVLVETIYKLSKQGFPTTSSVLVMIKLQGEALDIGLLLQGPLWLIYASNRSDNSMPRG